MHAIRIVLYINTTALAPRHGPEKVPVSAHVAHDAPEPPRHHGQDGREQGGLGRRDPAHQEVDSRRLGDRSGKVYPVAAGDKARVRERREAHNRAHRGHWRGRERAAGAHRCGDGHLPERKGRQARGRQARAGRPAAVDRRRRPAAPRGHAQGASRPRPLVLARGSRRRWRVQDGRSGAPRRPGRPPDRQGRRQADRGQIHGDGGARRRGARRVRDRPGRLQGLQGRRQGGCAGPRLLGACARTPGAGRRGGGRPSGCSQGGSWQPSCVPRARAPGAAGRPPRRCGPHVCKGHRDRPVVRPGARVPRACVARGVCPGRRARRRVLRGRPCAGSPRRVGARGMGPRHGRAGHARRGGRTLQGGHADRPRRCGPARGARACNGRARPRCGCGRRVRGGDRDGRGARNPRRRSRPHGRQDDSPEVQARRRVCACRPGRRHG